MLARLAIAGFLIAAAIVLLDRGELWHFTQDPSRRLVAVGYWIVHALLVAAALSSRQVFVGEAPTYAKVLGLIGWMLLRWAIAGLLLADGVVLIKLIFAEHAVGAYAIIVALFLALLVGQALWRLFYRPPLTAGETGDDGTDFAQMTWKGVLGVSAAVPLAVFVLFLSMVVFVAAATVAHPILAYTVLEEPPDALVWPSPGMFARLLRVGEIFAVLAVALVLWVILEKLLVRPKQPTQPSA